MAVDKIRCFLKLYWSLRFLHFHTQLPEGVLLKGCVLKNFVELTGKQMCHKRLWQRCFPVIFAKFLHLYRTSMVAASAFPYGFKRTINVLCAICRKYVSALICYDKDGSFRKGINSILHNMVYSRIIVNQIYYIHTFKSCR